MRDAVKAIAYFIILGTAISITIPAIPAILFWALVYPPIGACRDLTPTDCAFYEYVAVWVEAAIAVGSVYIGFRVWNWIQSPRG